MAGLGDAVREGLSSAVVRAEPFVQPSYALGKGRGDLTKALAVVADLEDLEVAAKLRRNRCESRMSTCCSTPSIESTHSKRLRRPG